MEKVLIVIPAHNEEDTIYEVVVRSLKYADVSVTDDGSRDATPDILKRISQECKSKKHPHSLNVITHASATHIPRAIQDGLAWGTERSYDYLITMDAGLSHNPDELPNFIACDRNVDLVIGSRRKTRNVPLYRKMISRLGAVAVNYTLSPSYIGLGWPGIKDCTSGFRRYGARAATLVARSALKSQSFDFHMEALALCVRAGMRTAEIPITYVFSSSSFTMKVLMQAIRFGMHLLATKRINSRPT